MEIIFSTFLLPSQSFSWVHVLGLFLFFAGFIIGLGAVTVIDTLGFLGMRSTYWTETTIRAHKVTKPLIWIGMLLAITGGIVFYLQEPYSPIMRVQSFLAGMLICNGIFLSFYISPALLAKEKKEKKHITLLPASMQAKIAVSFVISFIGWWSSVLLLVLYLLQR